MRSASTVTDHNAVLQAARDARHALCALRRAGGQSEGGGVVQQHVPTEEKGECLFLQAPGIHRRGEHWLQLCAGLIRQRRETELLANLIENLLAEVVLLGLRMRLSGAPQEQNLGTAPPS